MYLHFISYTVLNNLNTKNVINFLILFYEYELLTIILSVY